MLEDFGEWSGAHGDAHHEFLQRSELASAPRQAQAERWGVVNCGVRLVLAWSMFCAKADCSVVGLIETPICREETVEQ